MQNPTYTYLLTDEYEAAIQGKLRTYYGRGKTRQAARRDAEQRARNTYGAL